MYPGGPAILFREGYAGLPSGTAASGPTVCTLGDTWGSGGCSVVFDLHDHEKSLFDLYPLPDGKIRFNLLVVSYAIGEILVEIARGEDEHTSHKDFPLDSNHHLVQGTMA